MALQSDRIGSVLTRLGMALALVLAAAGPSAAQATAAPPAPTSAVTSTPTAGDAPAGPRLFVDCRGKPTTAPTVILEAGAFGTSADFDYLLTDLAKTGRACAYDRAGLGHSPPDQTGVDVLARARELANLLDEMGETGRVILVGHSNGALYVRAFAEQWPQRVAGLVYVNGVGPEALDDPRLLADLRAERRASNLAVTVGDLGLAAMVAEQLIDPLRLRPRAAARKRRGLVRSASLRVARDEDAAIIPGLTAVRDLGDAARHIPTAVVEGALRPDRPLARAWKTAQLVPAAEADIAWVLDMPGATHVSPLTRDRAYVVAAVDWLRAPFLASPASVDP
jgi:pimeloyl-ACP methyl ester carboxylesterase